MRVKVPEFAAERINYLNGQKSIRQRDDRTNRRVRQDERYACSAFVTVGRTFVGDERVVNLAFRNQDMSIHAP